MKVILESLVFTCSGDACLNIEEFDVKLAADLASRVSNELMDEVKLASYIYDWNDEECWEDEITKELLTTIRQLKTKN